VVFLPDEDKKTLAEKLKKEIAKLEWEEKLLRKRDDSLKWEEEMLQRGDAEPRGAGGSDGGGKSSGEGRTEPPKQAEVKLEPGATYLMLEENPQRSINLYLNEMKAGMNGLYITRSNPHQVKKEFDLGDSKVCWLTGVRASDEIVSISGLQELSILISNSIDENPKTVIFLDGVEYLVSNNEFPIVLRLIQQIRDKVSTSESKMIIPVNPNALEGRQLTLLGRECKMLK
jgi:hypothetical protein